MIYRCRKCDLEEARGVLPSASCGVYFVILLAVSVGSLQLAVDAIRLLVRRSPPAEETPIPWWAWIIGVPLTLLLIWFWTLAIKFVLESAEWLAFCRRGCPACGSRKWSWGFTRGFGL